MTWATERINAANCHGTLTIGGVSMNRDAWAVLNNVVLWQPAKRRGSDTIIPGLEGVLPHRRRRTVTTYGLELLIVGDVDYNGDLTGDRDIGLEENVAFLDEFVFDLPSTNNSLRTAVLTLPSGATRTGPVHVQDITFGTQISGAISAVMEVSIPYGQLGDRVMPGS